MEEFTISGKLTKKARANIAGPGISGEAIFSEIMVGGGFSYVRIEVTVKGDITILTPGLHAMHIHEKGDCECDGFKCAGGHFDPGPSGNTDPDANHGFHAGDLPNIEVDQNGNAKATVLTSRISLSDGPVSILQPEEGTSIMIHANQDPHTPGETGSGHSGGPRLACGKIEPLAL